MTQNKIKNMSLPKAKKSPAPHKVIFWLITLSKKVMLMTGTKKIIVLMHSNIILFWI